MKNFIACSVKRNSVRFSYQLMVRKIVESRRTENSIVREEDKGVHLIDLMTLAAQKEMEAICSTFFRGSEIVSFLSEENS